MFRADADSEIGSGHFVRSLSLAVEWVRQGHQAVMVGGVPEALVDRARGFGVGYRELVVTGSLEDDSIGLIAICGELGAQIVCVDGYKFDPDYVGRVRDSGVSVIEFSDGPIWLGYRSDLLLDQNLGAEDQTYDVASWTRELLGVKYVSLASRFMEYAGVVRSTSSPASNLLVSMGGADPKDATTIVLEAIFELGDPVNLTVTVGVSNPRKEEIAVLVKRDGGGEVVVDAQNMAELMAGTDIAIAAAGSTSWELAFMGVPTLLVAVAANQVRIAEQLDDAGAAVNLRSIDDLTAALLKQEIGRLIDDYELRVSMSKSGQELVDGKGASRVVAEMLSQIQ